MPKVREVLKPAIIARAALPLALCIALAGCSADDAGAPARADAKALPDSWGEMSVLIGDAVDLGAAKVSMDGKVLGYLDRSCGLIAAAPSGAHEVIVEWDTARISEVLMISQGEMTSVEISPDLTFIPTEPVKRSASTCSR